MYLICQNSIYSFRKDQSLGNQQSNPVKRIKEGCRMMFKGMKQALLNVKFEGVAINIGFIGLNFTGGSS